MIKTNRRMRSLLWASLIALLSSTSALAQPGPPRGWSAGAGLVLRDTAYVGADGEQQLLPLLQYEGERWRWRGLRVDWTIVDGDTGRWSVLAQARMDSVKADEVVGFPELRARERSVDVGLAYQRGLGSMQLEIAALTDALDRSGGQELAARLQWPIAAGRGRITPELGLRWWSSRLADYYYGVDADEFGDGGVSTYRPGASTLLELGVGSVYPLGTHWSLAGNLRWRVLPDALRDSPLVDGDGETSVLIGLTRRF
jgi:outer membrane protein